MKPHQCKAARALIGWTIDDLSKAAGLARGTIVDFERDQRTTYPSTVEVLQRTLERAGVVFMAVDAAGYQIRGVGLREESE